MCLCTCIGAGANACEGIRLHLCARVFVHVLCVCARLCVLCSVYGYVSVVLCVVCVCVLFVWGSCMCTCRCAGAGEWVLVCEIFAHLGLCVLRCFLRVCVCVCVWLCARSLLVSVPCVPVICLCVHACLSACVFVFASCFDVLRSFI